MTGVLRNKGDKLLIDLGTVCSEFQDRELRNLPSRRIPVDEVWSYCYAKRKNVSADKKGVFGSGDVRTWMSICEDTKLVPCWLVAGRDGEAAETFAKDLASRMGNRFQLTSDGHKAYLGGETAFGGNVDCSMPVKLDGAADDGGPERRHSRTSALGAGKCPSSANRTRGTSRPLTPNVRTSRCGCGLAGSRG